MKLWRFEFGKVKSDEPIEFKFHPLLIKEICGCYIFTVLDFYFTYLNDECYYSYKKNKNE